MSSSSTIRILLLNPNSSEHMTEGMLAAAKTLSRSKNVHVTSYTAPSSSPASINDDKDISASTSAVLSHSSLIESIESAAYDAVLIACFSVHSLVAKLPRPKSVAVTGIFEASILTSLGILGNFALTDQEKWGIVTTGSFWEDHLTAGVDDFLGLPTGSSKDEAQSKFAGVVSTGLNAGDFHDLPPEVVKDKLKSATRRLLSKGEVRVVVMGCGGMAGLEEIIREVAEEVYGEITGKGVFVVDGVQAGVLQLESTVRSYETFGGNY